MSAREDPRRGQSITTDLNLFTPIAGSMPGYVNKPLNGNVGTYTVYPIFVPNSVSSNYKAYIVTCFITGMSPATQSTGNNLPSPSFTSYWIPFVDNYSSNNVLFFVEPTGNRFTVKNTSNTNPVNPMTFSTFVIGV